MKKTFSLRNILVASAAILFTVFYISGIVIPQKTEASGNVFPQIRTFQPGTSTLITSTSNILVATNTARTYLEVSNLSSTAIFCNTNGLAARQFVGITIFASSTKVWSVDSPNYTGALNCIASGNASTTILER